MSRPLPRIAFPIELDQFCEVIDVRSPSEYEEDHLVGAINLPVLNDEQRAKVGTIFKQESPFEARKMGAALVSQNIAIHLQRHFHDKPKDYRPLIYCWRGGQRSGGMATVLGDIGWEVTLLDGGYRAYRAHVMERIEKWVPELKLLVLNGYTGAGKTLLLRRLQDAGEQVLDLEAMAHHKGSVFGGDLHSPQPAQKRFESELLRSLKEFDREKVIFVEAESGKIGRINLPNPLWKRLKASPVIEVDSPVQSRAEYLLSDYQDWISDLDRVHATIDRLAGFHPEKTLVKWKEMTQVGEWKAFVKEILTEHYDKRYSVDGSGNYEPPMARVELKHHDESSVSAAVEQIRRVAFTFH